MKYLDKIEARNVVNTDAIAKWLDKNVKPKIKRSADTPELAGKVEKWFETTFRKYLIKEYPKTKKVSKIPADAPEWMKTATDLVQVELGTKLKDTTDHLIDYFVGVEMAERISATDAIKQSEEWISKGGSDLEVDLGQDTIEDVDIIDHLSDGFYVAYLKSAAGIKREGRRMGHCLKSPEAWFKQIKRDGLILLSIRTPQGKPTVTFEIDKQGHIHQMKGTQNTAADQKYHKHIHEFLKKQGAM